jgi:hypothetical protein
MVYHHQSLPISKAGSSWATQRPASFHMRALGAQ